MSKTFHRPILDVLRARLLEPRRFLQVLAAPRIQAQATRTSVRLVYEQAPRGFVFDRKGIAIARNRGERPVPPAAGEVIDDDDAVSIDETRLQTGSPFVAGIFSAMGVFPFW